VPPAELRSDRFSTCPPWELRTRRTEIPAERLTPRRAIPSFLGMDLRGHLDLMLLATLGHTGPTHGYALIAALRDRSANAFDLPEGTVYPALHRLEDSGLLRSYWAERGGRRRRLYEITAEGVRAHAGLREEWRAFSHGVRAVLA
jgi:PadR family transcriptional regulator, regulatory protein PadR